MAKTVLDLTTRVLRELRVVAATETPGAADAEIAGAYYRDLHAEWQARGNGAWDADDIPDEIFHPLAQYVAAHVAGTYGVAYASVSETERRLRAVTLPRDGGDVVPIQYF